MSNWNRSHAVVILQPVTPRILVLAQRMNLAIATSDGPLKPHEYDDSEMTISCKPAIHPTHASGCKTKAGNHKQLETRRLRVALQPEIQTNCPVPLKNFSTPSLQVKRVYDLIHNLSLASGYKSSRFSWLEITSDLFWDLTRPRACKMGIFSNRVRLSTCRIS